mmetsp:Transcript_33378/g.66187  ORF Transcript_33378/g.66187 Transcript_33378/m.66187 type:complete len:237 (-) Transcript_33378:453-1163(-)
MLVIQACTKLDCPAEKAVSFRSPLHCYLMKTESHSFSFSFSPFSSSFSLVLRAPSRTALLALPPASHPPGHQPEAHQIRLTAFRPPTGELRRQVRVRDVHAQGVHEGKQHCMTAHMQRGGGRTLQRSESVAHRAVGCSDGGHTEMGIRTGGACGRVNWMTSHPKLRCAENNCTENGDLGVRVKGETLDRLARASLCPCPPSTRDSHLPRQGGPRMSEPVYAASSAFASRFGRTRIP